MEFKYRTKVSGDEAIVAERQYSFMFQVWTPDFTWETIKAGLDALVATLRDRYGLRTAGHVLWVEPAYPSTEIFFTFREAPGQDLNWFAREVEKLAEEYYMRFYLQEIATFLPRPFPWWLLFLAFGIGVIAVRSATKEKGD